MRVVALIVFAALFLLAGCTTSQRDSVSEEKSKKVEVLQKLTSHKKLLIEQNVEFASKLLLDLFEELGVSDKIHKQQIRKSLTGLYSGKIYPYLQSVEKEIILEEFSIGEIDTAIVFFQSPQARHIAEKITPKVIMAFQTKITEASQANEVTKLPTPNEIVSWVKKNLLNELVNMPQGAANPKEMKTALSIGMKVFLGVTKRRQEIEDKIAKMFREHVIKMVVVAKA